MNKITLLSPLLFSSFFLFSQVSIPDSNFEAELIVQGIDSDGIINAQISVADVLGKTGTLNLDNLDISDLTGIEAFTNISQLRFDDNSVSSIDISALTSLTQIRCANNNLSSLNVSNNTALTQIRVQNNNLSTIDVSSNSNLARLYLDENTNITSIDVSSNLNLQRLFCRDIGTGLTSIDVSNNTALTYLIINGNGLTSINVSTNTLLVNLQFQNNSISGTVDISNNTALTNLRVQNNSLTTLDVSSNTLLQDFRCNGNDLTSLDITANTSLTQLSCQSNDLSTLNAKNGSNTSISSFNANNNPQLSCIEVDDVAYADANFTKPSGAVFSTDCSVLNIEDLSVNDKIIIYPNPIKNSLNIQTNSLNVNSIEIFDIKGQKKIKRGSLSENIDVSSLNSGLYFIKIFTDINTITRKFVKE